MHLKKVIKSVIIDDEINAILLLEEMLHKIEGIRNTGYATDIRNGINIILHEHPDIVFLDIKLNNENGFDLIKSLKEFNADPYFVMVTGFDQFGMDALKSGAFDYIVKPVDPAELLKVIAKYQHKQARVHYIEPVHKIRFNTLGGFILINPEDILYCKAEANYTDIFLTNMQKHTISLNIGSIENMLNNHSFFRTSRSIIINLKYLTEINRSKRLCTLSHLDHIIPLCIAHDRIKDLEEVFIQ